MGERMSGGKSNVLERRGVSVPIPANSDLRLVGDPAPVTAERQASATVLPLDRRARIGVSVAASRAKRMFDIAASLFALVLAAPLMLVIYIAVKLDGGPGVFVQRRVGRDGGLFPCFKFRTMIPDAENVLIEMLNTNAEMKKYWNENRKLPQDPRVTKLGVFLRRKSLDELPQLVNVLLGQMSFVGPRPIVPEEKECYGSDFKFYAQARPGLTGAWQVSGRNERSYAERVALDVEYVSTWTFATDIRILVATVGAVISGRGAS